MAIDVHAHYVPLAMVDGLRAAGERLGIAVLGTPPSNCSPRGVGPQPHPSTRLASPCQLRFPSGLEVRPFFPKLVEEEDARIAGMAQVGIERQILSTWMDILGYELPPAAGAAWHRILNDSLAEVCRRHPGQFSMLASGPLPDAAEAARELERAVRELGAVGAVAATNVEGVNLGELSLDELWAAAVELDVPVFLHPAQPVPTARTRRFALNQVVQYTFDTTLAVGSLIESGVLDRFPTLRLILSHGGGALPYLIGRFDCMHDRSDRASTGMAATSPPSAYLSRMYYDTILHDGPALRYLERRVGVDRLVVGSDDGFPPADRDPLASLRRAGFTEAEVARIAEENPRRLFRLPGYVRP